MSISTDIKQLEEPAVQEYMDQDNAMVIIAPRHAAGEVGLGTRGRTGADSYHQSSSFSYQQVVVEARGPRDCAAMNSTAQYVREVKVKVFYSSQHCVLCI
jgi:hypothetical protein